MKQEINQRIDALRRLFDATGIDAFIVPSTDPHLSEYVAPHWMAREWISGFNGSAGTVVVTRNEAGLWTDSRYFLQAFQQLEGSCIQLYKEGLAETPSIIRFLASRLPANSTVGIDGAVFAVKEVAQMKEELTICQLSVKDIGDPFNALWENRPPMPEAPAVIYDEAYAGESCQQKIARLREKIQAEGAQALLVCALDEIAWVLNLRGNDVHCNPVVVSYLLITEQEVHYFIQPAKVTEEVSAYLRKNGITLHPYEETADYLQQLPPCTLWMDPAKTNYAVRASLSSACEVMEKASPVALMKAIRNEQEIAGIRTAMQRDGVALVRFLYWLEKAVARGGETEMSVSQKLHDLRAAQPLYRGESFDTIAGYGEHGAIVHYEATPETDVPLHNSGFLLLDSGAQYLDGTTDITRTIALGALTEEEKTDYTLILKGHIALATAVFPEGTRGAQLDVLARMPLWQHYMNYLHGTGHGVGHFLNVHEGPQSIRMNENPVPLHIGMVTSNEPGVYKAGSHGVRTENLLLTVPAGEGMFGRYLRFETLTLCPICKKGIRREMLTQAEMDWLNSYHHTVYEQLAPDLTDDEREWLADACAPV